MKNYTLIRSKRKTVALVIDPDATLTVRAPLRMPVFMIEAIVNSKRQWINRSFEKVKARPTAKIKQFIPDEKFLYLGTEYNLNFTTLKNKYFFDHGFYLSYSLRDKAKTIFESWYKKQAKIIITQRVEFYATQNNLRYKKIRISTAQKRWGSCRDKNLNFNWRLIMAPVNIIDYVVVHELAHLEFKNHSQTFWDQVELVYPPALAARQWLKQYGQLLKI
ncbi:MAG: SprT family zinc-dependent metalloprotease [Patescibacteria group bacterium]|nr:SprT family zinc-dependent metalloprotease [Patescibacteria group bacterium]